MATIPDSMDDLVYFSRRSLTEKKGKVIAWARKQQCPKCKKALMGKPADPKTGKIMIRAKEYVCPSCGNAEEKKEHEAKIKAEIVYECPFCANKGETTAPFARKTWYGKKAIVFPCGKCGEKLGVTKKMAVPPDFQAKVEGKPVKKGKTEEAEIDDEDDDF